jgi:hypothetical protein
LFPVLLLLFRRNNWKEQQSGAFEETTAKQQQKTSKAKLSKQEIYFFQWVLYIISKKIKNLGVKNFFSFEFCFFGSFFWLYKNYQYAASLQF